MFNSTGNYANFLQGSFDYFNSNVLASGEGCRRQAVVNIE
jgi:hypothetical protein